MTPAEIDPIATFAEVVKRHGSIPLAWAVEHCADADPLPAAWTRCTDPIAMATILGFSQPNLLTRAIHKIQGIPPLYVGSLVHGRVAGRVATELAGAMFFMRLRRLQDAIECIGNAIEQSRGTPLEIDWCAALRGAMPTLEVRAMLAICNQR